MRTTYGAMNKEEVIPRLGGRVTMSLRGSETTEAISQCIDNSEIAALPSVARNDKKGIVTQSVRGMTE